MANTNESKSRMEKSNDFCSCSELKTNSAVLVIRENRVWVGLGAEPPLKEPGNSVAWESLSAQGQSLQVASEVTWRRSVCEGDRKR